MPTEELQRIIDAIRRTDLELETLSSNNYQYLDHLNAELQSLLWDLVNEVESLLADQGDPP
jgi:hypothetical protein